MSTPRLNRSCARMNASLPPSGEKTGDESPPPPKVGGKGLLIDRGSPPSVGTIQTEGVSDWLPLNASSLPSGDQDIRAPEKLSMLSIWPVVNCTSRRSSPPSAGI